MIKRFTALAIAGLVLIPIPSIAQEVSQRISPIDGQMNDYGWVLPAGIGAATAGALYQQVNSNGLPIPQVMPMNGDSGVWDEPIAASSYEEASKKCQQLAREYSRQGGVRLRGELKVGSFNGQADFRCVFKRAD